MCCVMLQEELQKHALNDSGNKLELQQRLADFFKVNLPTEDDVDKGKKGGKHSADWGSRILKTESWPFTDAGFNHESLCNHLAGFPARIPTPVECHQFFFTEDMWKLGLNEFNQYPRHIHAQQVRPPWVPSNQPWPPKWCENPLRFNMEEYKHHTMLLHMLGLKRCGDHSVRSMFSKDRVLSEHWLKDLTSRIKFEGFLRQLHFEDAGDPTGTKWEHSQNYRPNGVPKVGLLMEYFRRRCVLFHPEKDLSFDGATAKYGGRMTNLKHLHLQSKYKPYDDIRIYSLNGSKTGYTQNFRVDLRDGTSVETMFRGVLQPFEGHGYTVWGDNAFTSVAMLKHTKEKKINFADTTHTTFGFPAHLIDTDLPMGEWK